MHISRLEGIIFVATIFAAPAIILTIGAIQRGDRASAVYTMRDRQYQKPILETSVITSVTAQQVIGKHPTYFGSPKSPFTLVEFGDYQCPPCRHMDRNIKEAISLYPGKLRYTFRNLPLTLIHPLAFSAAVAAEAARRQNKFWQMHDFLMINPLDSRIISTAPQALQLNKLRFACDSKGAARSEVNADIKNASEFGVMKTPSFLLCCPDGKVLHLKNLDALENFVYGH